MKCTYFVLAFATLATSITFGAVIVVTKAPAEVTVTKEDIQTQAQETIEFLGIEKSIPANGDNRAANLKFVKAIQSSSIWSEIKRRSLTVRTEPKLDQVLKSTGNRSPDNLSDDELTQLKKACHDGLKCVAVDQILVLKKVKEPLEPMNSNYVSTRLAITKITKVLTDYTNEYHEDTFQYEVVKASDDPSKVYVSMTTIVEDNKELCKIDNGSHSSYSNQNTDDDNSKNIDQHGTVNNYNINNGTINNATVNIDSSDNTKDTKDTKDTPYNETSDNVDVSNGTSSGGNLPNGASSNNDISSTNPTESSTTTALVPYVPPTSIIPDNHETSAEASNVGTSQNDISVNKGTVATQNVEPKIAEDETQADNVKDNYVKSEGGNGNEPTYVSADIASSGPHNKNNLKKGIVDDGTLNNGKINSLNINKGTINKGVINKSKADNGIINVGTVNNGPVNAGQIKNNNNNGTIATLDNYQIQQFVKSVDKMYSSILEGLAQ